MARKSVSPDVVVVGAGVIGAAVAFQFASAGLRVQVLEAGLPGLGVTAAGMGHIAVMDDSPAQFRLSAYSRSLFDEMADDLPASCEVDRCGTLWIATDQAQLGQLQQKAAAYQAGGVAAEVLDKSATLEAAPCLVEPLAGALHVPGDSVVYPPAFARWLLARATDRGAEIRTGVRVDRFRKDGVRAGSEKFSAGLVVNATGPEAGLSIPDLPVEPRRGHLVITERYPGFCRHQLVELGYLDSAHGGGGSSVAFNLQPRKTGQLLIGSSREMVGWDARVQDRVVAQMLRRALRFVPGLASLKAVRAWTGFRPAVPDNLPLIGPWGGADGIWLAVGHEGLGITTALATARLLVDHALGRTADIDPTPYLPARLAAVEPAAP